MVGDSKPITFRVRRVPASLTRRNLAVYLSGLVKELGSAENIRVRSIAATPDDWNLPRKQTATIEFSQVPVCLQDERKREFLFFIEESEDTLLFDKAFLGFTPLNNVDRHDCDCIAISGLASHPFGSWRQGGSQQQQFMWLRDQLPNDFKHMRIMTYGYDTALFDSESLQDIDDLARTFISHLKAIGRAEITAKPLILLAHSLGGIIVKRALSYLAASGEAENFMLSKVRLLLCFGVPNQGMHIKHLLAMTKGRPNEVLVNALSTTSPYLEQLDKSFSGIAIHRSIRLVSAYETVKSSVALLNSSGEWKRTGPPEYLVTRESAILSGSRDPEDIIHVNRDHSDMVKFAPDDPDYLSIRQFVLETVGLVRTSDFIVSSNDTGQVASASQNSPSVKLPYRANNIASEGLVAAYDADKSSDEPRDSLDRTGILRAGGVPYHGAMSETRGPMDDVAKQDLKSALLANLDFQDRTHRLTTIEVAERTTFGWIFTDKSIGFMDWLFDQKVLFWIRGKPGSGKSTLMKYLHDNMALRDALKHRNSTRKQVNLWFFFNDRGNYLEKSLDGLLRSILFQIREQERDLFKVIFDAQDFLSDREEAAWNIERLTSMFDAFMLQQTKDLDLVLFLDALDEYHGFPEIIARWIANLAFTHPSSKSRTTVKICVSCRPGDVFVKIFSSCPGFILHEYTTEDIEQYTVSRLSHMSCNLSDAQLQGLLRTISKRAEGVFLWVKLAIEELSISSNQMSLVELEELIWKMPGELQDFYTRTIHRLPQHNRLRAYMLLEIMYRAPELDLAVLSDATILYCVLACAKGATFQDCQELLTQREQNITRDTRDRIQELVECSGGLLEIIPSLSNPALATHLQFMHKTARDFVGLPGFAQTVLQDSHLVQIENGYTYLFKWITVTPLLGSMSVPGDITRRYYYMTLSAHLDEKTSGRPLTTFINSLPALFFQHFSLPSIQSLKKSLKPFNRSDYLNYVSESLPATCTSSFGFAVNGGLRLYVRSVLSVTNRQLIIPEMEGEMLLMSAVLFTARLASFSAFDYLHSHEANLPDVLEVLFDYGFNDKKRHDGLNAFALCTMLSGTFYTGDGFAGATEIARTFIEQGKQDPNEIFHFTMVASRYTAAAIHISAPEMTRMLCENGADPNILDCDKNTALDVALDSLILTNESRAVRLLITASTRTRSLLWSGHLVEKVSLLLAFGGTITSRWANKIAKHMRRFEESLSPADIEALKVLKPLQHTARPHKHLAGESPIKLSWSKFSRKSKFRPS